MVKQLTHFFVYNACVLFLLLTINCRERLFMLFTFRNRHAQQVILNWLRVYFDKRAVFDTGAAMLHIVKFHIIII